MGRGALRIRVTKDNHTIDIITAHLKSKLLSFPRAWGSSFTPCTSPLWQPGDATTVKVDYKYSVFFPVFFGTEIPLSSESKMRIE